MINILYNILKIWNKLQEIVIEKDLIIIDIFNNYKRWYLNETEFAEKIKFFLLENIEENISEILKENFGYNISFIIKELNKSLIRKLKKLKTIEIKNWKELTSEDIIQHVETAFKWSFYMYIRHLYNNKILYKLDNHFYSVLFFFIREYAYSWMFRYNAKGEFNVPYGGISYNNKNFKKKVDYLNNKTLLNHLNRTNISDLDFEVFFNKYPPWKNDFIFLDPPYDSAFSTYDQNTFDKMDQERLSNYLIKECKAKWMIVIKNTEFIFNLYNKKWINIQSFDKKYLVSFMNELPPLSYKWWFRS